MASVDIDQDAVNVYNNLMTSKEKWEKRNWLLFLSGYFAIGYLVINWFNESRSYYFDVAFPFERHIPFIPFFILGYLFVYASVLILYLLVNDIILWRRTVVSFIVLTTLCYIIFLIFPVRMTERPEVADMIVRNLLDKIARFYFVIDRPYNLLPSIHAAYPTLTTILAWRAALIGRWFLLAMTVIIAVSVVLVKQHYIMDVVAGIFAAFISYYVVAKTEKVWSSWFAKKST